MKRKQEPPGNRPGSAAVPSGSPVVIGYSTPCSGATTVSADPGSGWPKGCACDEQLHERGITVETLKFHQMRSGESTATFIRGTNGTRAEWAMG